MQLFGRIIFLSYLVVIPCLLFSPLVKASDKCGESYVDYQSEDGMTEQERLRAMDQALYDALNKYDDCLTQSDSSDGGASGTSGGNSGSAAGGNGSVNSTASSGIEGTEKPPEQTATALSATEQEALEDSEEGTVPQNMPNSLQNGKVPDDIPSADNDDILQQKVREAAENETDPEKRERLWNEYRKLKGLPEA